MDDGMTGPRDHLPRGEMGEIKPLQLSSHRIPPHTTKTRRIGLKACIGWHVADAYDIAKHPHPVGLTTVPDLAVMEINIPNPDSARRNQGTAVASNQIEAIILSHSRFRRQAGRSLSISQATIGLHIRKGNPTGDGGSRSWQSILIAVPGRHAGAGPLE